jgi:phospholysine phosphohistidine inorganic pyrophosphate phosphatase
MHSKYYAETDGLKLDVGAYSAALQFACDVHDPIIIGKPSATYFQMALDDMHMSADEVRVNMHVSNVRTQVVMIGDDIVSDVGGAQRCGMRAVQVQTGKWQLSEHVLL